MPSKTQRKGARSEELAENLLRKLGYQIIGRNWRSKHLEIDRIAWDGATLVFVEVRSRSTTKNGTPQESISLRKRRLLQKAAALYLQGLAVEPPPAMRFDVVCLVNGECELIKDAFDVHEFSRQSAIWVI
ncbi:MAG: YraN family protein [Myxococcota bacterium]|nr:YraN family protein [Myxococcota bacterium]